MLAEELKASDVRLEFLTGELKGREQEMSLRDIAKRLVIATGTKKGRHPSPATVRHMLREHDEHTGPWGRRRARGQ
ncbi:hypothetical protein ACFVFI_36625 [Streptomyces sp. NPDC057705]|uniref:hypothetical protein n=1 Tax=Streptomyces sp. NPDC057705 TaxID=3346222 RepID=UPI0036B5274D